MCSLRRLSLIASADDTVHIAPAISALTALQSLHLHGLVRFPAECRLPTSITRLRVAFDDSDEMPQQASRVGFVPSDAS